MVYNTVTRERCTVITACVRFGPGFGGSGGTSIDLTWIGPYCGADFTGGSCQITYNAVKGLGVGGGLGVCGGFSTSADIGPQAGAQLSLTFDVCYLHVLNCSNTPCECL